MSPSIRIAQRQRYLMCRPTYFAVDHAINPWRDPTVPVDTELAIGQWDRLVEVHRALGHSVEPVVGLRLIDPHFYHLDTALLASRAEAETFALNAVSDGRHVVLPRTSERILRWLGDQGFEPFEVGLSEFRKAGGGPKCCTLDLHRPPPVPVRALGGARVTVSGQRQQAVPS